MGENQANAVAIVGMGVIMPDAPDAGAFWHNIKTGRYSISDVDPTRWDPARYYDPDPRVPDKTYSKIGGWVRSFDWEPLKWRLPVPPKVADAMDDSQKWAVNCTRAALLDYGYPERALDNDRTAVIVGNAMAGEKHYLTSLRVFFPEYADDLTKAASFSALPSDVQKAILSEFHEEVAHRIPSITEDTMPGELSNVIAGRIANLFNFHGTNYVIDAACATAMAAMSSAVLGLLAGHYDAVLTGGVDRNMSPTSFVKFCKIGALSATGSRPYGDGADGFVMGEGAGIFLLKRLADAERDGDRIYAVVRGIGGSSDGKGKSVTAPNPVGQRLAVEWAWQHAGLSPATVSLIEGHGTSTKVGDVVEVDTMSEVFGGAGAGPGSIALGSVKSNIGHLKAAAGAAGIFKAAMALHEKVLPPSLNAERLNPNVDWATSPFRVNTELREWEVSDGQPRRAAVSAFGFGGTNFHVVLEEHVPGRLTTNGKSTAVGAAMTRGEAKPVVSQTEAASASVRAQSEGGGREPLVVTGAAVGLPGTERVFDPENLVRLLGGEVFIKPIPHNIRQAIVDKRITRLVKSKEGAADWKVISDPSEVIKLAGRKGSFDLESEFGVDADRVPALDITSRLSIAAGIDALRDAGIPLTMHWKTTTKGTKLPERWGLPDALRDETGVIFASALPGADSWVQYLNDYNADRSRRQQLSWLEQLRATMTSSGNTHSPEAEEVDRRIAEVREALERKPFEFDRRFLFRVVPFAHAQFAELVGARGPNATLNAACATMAQSITIAEDWIRSGRCRRVIIISADDAGSDNLLEWIGSAFLASGAAATDERVEDAATPFDRRRHGMLLGMGAAAYVVETAQAARERGIRPIAELLAAVTYNSAFHGTRLDVNHIEGIMDGLLRQAEQRWDVDRHEIAPKLAFMSHETYTPARGGSAAAEVQALRHTFGDDADRIVVANTKGFTGHAMGVGVEDVVILKVLETGIVPPIPNFREVDPDLGTLNFSKGGKYPVEYGLHLAAGFGSQIAMTLLRRVPSPDGSRPAPDHLGYEYRIADPVGWEAWLSDVSGYSEPEVEVVQHRLRVRNQGPPPREPRPVPAAAPAHVLASS